MKKVTLALISLILFISCNSKNKELEKLKIENEKMKGEIQQMEKDKLTAEYRKMFLLAMSDIKLIGSAIESFTTDWSKPPAVKSLKDLAFDPKFVPFYIKKLPYLDPWGNEYFYKYSMNGDYGTYWVGCAGSDGVFNGFDQIGQPALQPGIDIVYSNGLFKLWAK